MSKESRIIVELLTVYSSGSHYLQRLWDGVRFRARRRKCVVSGCEIPARGSIGRRLLMDRWTVCGVHRKPIADLLNAAEQKRLDAVIQARREYTVAIINGLNELGCHEDELALAVGDR